VVLASAAERGRVTELRARGHRRVVAVGAAEGVEAWSLLAAGASDVIDVDERTAAVLLARLERWAEIDRLLASDLVRKNLVGASAPWVAVLEQLIEAARFSTRPVLVTGNSGTGKEMAARLVHTLDPRPDKGQLVVLDCTTIVPSLSGSELFGHAKGAFTGADSARRGAFALADKGTLFLDEIGELAPALQCELLRVIQEGMYKPVGSDRWERAQFRLVCATNRDLGELQGTDAFRTDLYHRIAATTVHLPLLDERVQDVPMLARHFLETERGDDAPDLTPAVEAYLVGRRYPGNVRDLKHLISRMASHHVGPGPLTLGDIPVEERLAENGAAWRDDPSFSAAVHKAVGAGAGLRELKEVVAELAVGAALQSTHGNVALAARRLGITARALQMRQAAWRSTDPLARRLRLHV
jgi:transcriptional regulator with GAF, ATPase, and Fis domain